MGVIELGYILRSYISQSDQSKILSLNHVTQPRLTRNGLLDDSLALVEFVWVFLDHPVSCVAAVVEDQVGLPLSSADAFVDAPPKVVLRFSLPSENLV